MKAFKNIKNMDGQRLFILIFLLHQLYFVHSLREFRSYSTRSSCEMSNQANYPFAYSKYSGQVVESKGRTNSNLQDFRHQCTVFGGKSKCNICEEIKCNSTLDTCQLQLQGVQTSEMSVNIPVVSDNAWAVGGKFKTDYGGNNTYFCVMLTGGKCINPYNADYSGCTTRCFGYGFKRPAVKIVPSVRSVVDVYPGMTQWPGQHESDLWVFPRNCSELELYQNKKCTYSGQYNSVPSFNPQGYTFTLAGTGKAGFVDGPSKTARFNSPEDVAVDDYGNVYVADTKNNAIRLVQTNGIVKTIAGKGPNNNGYRDGPCSEATFSKPKGLDVRLETINSALTAVIIVADTGNHRIRRIEYVNSTGDCVVKCLTGLCGNSSLSASSYSSQATPLTGFADGSGLVARFSAPESVTFMEGNYIAVADTGNFLIRWVVADNGSTSTLAGSIIPGQQDADGKPLPGCVAPCMQGLQGYRDGNLTYSQFYNPLDVTRGPNNTLWVTDEQRIRMITLPNQITSIYGIKSQAMVFTIAGTSLQGHDDGISDISNFYYSSGSFVDNDGVAYVIDAATCRVRRVTPYPLVAEQMTCSSKITDYIRPSGCVSYDPPIDKIGRKVSRVEGNIQYNYGYPFESDLDRGKYIKNCVGAQPHDKLDKKFVLKSGDNLVIDDDRTEVNENSEAGMAILLRCPGGCMSSIATNTIQGNTWYSDNSSVCISALHAGIISNEGGIILVTTERRDFLNFNNMSQFTQGVLSNGIRSLSIQESVFSVFSMSAYNVSNNMMHTLAGQPSAPLEDECGYSDGQPATLARFKRPSGIAARYGHKLSDTEYLYVADADNNMIRAVSAVCTFICENGGRCVGSDKCLCPSGWGGIDCTKPICSTACGSNSVCVGPNTCGCKPGYSGKNCNTPLCVQTCQNGGFCSAPNTCSCPSGWFDTNCTTPVCSQTCGNGGNCTAPNTCSCPKQWSGYDCRIPVCTQVCQNGGFCIAPDTCVCQPEYTNYDCSAPVCHQGYFEAYPGKTPGAYFSVTKYRFPTFKNCDLQSWCNATSEFECDQLDMTYESIELPSGGSFRSITGRKLAPKQCMNIELPIYYKIPFQLVYSDNRTTNYRRFQPFIPYTTNSQNAWRGYEDFTIEHTGPWTYDEDRQIANVVWFNVSQGRYVCANGGSCVAPEVCSCAPGWIGFDCRTPVCDQGYYKGKQSSYVSGLKTTDEVAIFSRYMGNNSYKLYWPYSNPNFTIQYEFYVSPDNVSRVTREIPGKRYLGPVNFTSYSDISESYQGGYRCSIRAYTEWENEYFVFDHPNFYSQYMNKKLQSDNVTYTFWTNMSWPPTHRHSRILDRYMYNISYAYTNEGWRRRGIWNRTSNPWEFGICIVEFKRNCSSRSMELDLESEIFNVLVQDTDLAYRPRITYNDIRVLHRGRWKESIGQCVDQVVRGCNNNGTCVAPNTCQCSKGWTGSGCEIPICSQTCFHHGNCTSPDVCTCERGWTGFDCQIPICAQECNNGGICVAPDTCKCFQFDSAFTDGRVDGGRPLFQDPSGNSLKTGWTGFDCSIPICVQAEQFILNVPSTSNPKYVSMGGHGADSLLPCIDTSGNTLPRCPQYDLYVTGNDGKSFQTGCGWDPYDTGCCIPAYPIVSNDQGVPLTCYKCEQGIVRKDNSSFYCAGETTVFTGTTIETDVLAAFVDPNNNFRICGEYHNPRSHDYTKAILDYGVAQYYIDVLNPDQTSYNFRSNWTSNRFLCNVAQWEQGDYVDDAGLGSITGVGSIYGLKQGRHIRTNNPNIIADSATQTFTLGPRMYGEGVYECYNKGTCIGPDTCTCTDGYTGYDCSTPLCRHLQPSGAVTSCLNGGICVSKDSCNCVQTNSVLWMVHSDAARGTTGWSGTDCSMPMCAQGYYDPFCTDLPQAPGGEGCYRCANGGNCTAPDVCTCAPGWTGFDCKTPVCEAVADPLTRTQLNTVYESQVIDFESDPCALKSIYGMRGWKGRKYAHGNCTQPNQCTCLCKMTYDARACRKTGQSCEGAWQDPLVAVRNVLIIRGPQFTFGSSECKFGYEGNVDSMDRFTTCHQTVYLPTTEDKQSLILIVVFTILGFFIILFYRVAAERIRRRFLLAKIERRKTKRSSEESLLSAGSGGGAGGGGGNSSGRFSSGSFS